MFNPKKNNKGVSKKMRFHSIYNTLENEIEEYHCKQSAECEKCTFDCKHNPKLAHIYKAEGE